MIKLIVTGGTLDKHYNPLTGQLDFSKTHLPALLQQARCTVDISLTELMLKDSLAMTDHDRQRICTCCNTSSEQHIIITHGTDTMVTTATQLATPSLDKTIVLVGAMVPARIKESDALFNLGSAMSAVQILPFGVYITMNGKVFSWDNVTKDTQAGEFKPLHYA